MKRHSAEHTEGRKGETRNAIENQYLAGKSLTFWETMLSIIATEFSAMAFLTIPTYVYFENLSYLRFVIGACISRLLISAYFLPKVYGKGLTIFEALGRGIHGYTNINREGLAGKKTFAFFYVVTKTIGTSVKLLGGSLLVAEFFDVSVFFAITLIAILTYLYIILGGLKAVVRTDRIQACIFVIGGLGAHFVVGKLSTYSWGELFALGWQAGKFSWFEGGSGFLSFLYGIIAGIVYDAATHGVDQDVVQKLFGTEDIKTAQQVLRWSAFGSFFVNLLFLTLGVILWAYYTTHGQALPAPEKLFSDLIEYHFPSPLKGLMVASILAASMSSLDSAINALSAVLWNDLMSVKESKTYRIFINIDNFIITLSIIVVAYFFSLVPGAIKAGLHFAYLSTGPLLAFFMCRMLLAKWIKVSYSPVLVFVTVMSCFLGFGINHFTLGFNPQLTIPWGLITTIAFIWIYSKIADFTASKREH
ncbi:MAG: sodium:solute symporter family transporter [Bacteriovoracaceae bacterium]